MLAGEVQSLPLPAAQQQLSEVIEMAVLAGGGGGGGSSGLGQIRGGSGQRHRAGASGWRQRDERFIGGRAHQRPH